MLTVALHPLYNSISGDCDEQGCSGYWSRPRAIALGDGRFGQPVARRPPGAAVWAFVQGLDLGEFYDRIRARDEIAGRPATDRRVVLASPWHRAMRALRPLPGKSVICVLIACALLVIQTPAFKGGRPAAAISALRPRRGTRYIPAARTANTPDVESGGLLPRPRRSVRITAALTFGSALMTLRVQTSTVLGGGEQSPHATCCLCFLAILRA
jgi:hypothetical protein